MPDAHLLSRRFAFKVAGLAGATVALRDRIAVADAPATKPAALPQGAGFYRTHVGEFEVTVISDGGLPQSPPFPTWGANAGKEAVEAALRDAFIDPADMVGQVNALLVRNGTGPYTLIDTGTGKLFGPGLGFVKSNLAAAGVSADDIATVVFTHLHPDHAGGAIGDGGPVFPRAKYLVHKAERDFWAGEKPDFSKCGASEELVAMVTGAAKKVLAALGPVLQTFDGPEHEIAPGIVAQHLPGHTPGHCGIRLTSGDAKLLYLADSAHSAVLSFGHPDWHLTFDTDRDAGVATRKAVYAKVAEERLLISGAHLPFPSLGHLKKAGDGFDYVPTPWRWS